ncbi:MAG: hypothetical protein ACLQMF_13110, partial [Rectinemataceae bacterium]
MKPITSQRNHHRWPFAAVLIFIVVALLAWPPIRERQLSQGFAAVRVGDTRGSVRSQMRHPWKDGACGYISDGPPGCAEEFIYAHPYAPLVPEYWIISFDSRHKVLQA